MLPCTSRVVATVLAALVPATALHAEDPMQRVQRGDPARALDFSTMAEWLKGLYSEAEFRALSRDDVRLESRQCNCDDRPTPHFPYLLVILNTPKGDLVLRPDQRELQVDFTRLALRQGDLYCSVEADAPCYGRFADACDFTDYRFGATLQPYFPTCKTKDE
jgi:hypothetical protein